MFIILIILYFLNSGDCQQGLYFCVFSFHIFLLNLKINAKEEINKRLYTYKKKNEVNADKEKSLGTEKQKQDEVQMEQDLQGQAHEWSLKRLTALIIALKLPTQVATCRGAALVTP